MNNQDKINIFSKELNFIKDLEIYELVCDVLSVIPEYFFTIPASSTGKYHPNYALGEGGLVRHTKSAVRIAIELLNNHSINNFGEIEKDIIISVLILHDTCKSGIVKNKYTITEHPLLACEVLDLFKGKYDNEVIKGIQKCIASHMGEWCFDYKTKEKVLPTPDSKMERFVHMCDYLASRKIIEMDFEVPLTRI